MKIRTKKCHWGEEKDFLIKGYILFEDSTLYDVVGDKREQILRHTAGLWFDNNKDSYLSFEIIGEEGDK